MYLPIVCAIFTITPLSSLSAAVIRHDEVAPNNPPTGDPDFGNNGISAPLLIYEMSSPRPEIEETHTASKTDKTVLSAGLNGILSQIDQTSISKTSPSANEVIDELNQTYIAKQADERAVKQVNHVHDYAQGKEPNGVEDLFLKDEINTVVAKDHSDGEKKMVGRSKSNIEEQISDPNGLNQTFFTVEDHHFHQVENQDSFEVTGNTVKNLTYLAGTLDDVTSFYTLNGVDKINLVKTGQGVEQDTKQSSLIGFGYADEVSETIALDDKQNTISIDNEGIQASIDVDKTHGTYRSMDWDGNQDVSVSDGTTHNINVTDGDIGVSLNTNNISNVYGFKDQDGVFRVYGGNGRDHSLIITDGEVTTNFDQNNVDELFGIVTPDGVDDVHKVNQDGKSVMIDNGEQSVAVGANEIKELHGVFDNGEMQESYQGNQVDKIVALAEGSSGGSLQTSEINQVYQVKDNDGNLQVVAAEGQMVGQTVVIGDDQIDGHYEVDELDELFGLTRVEAPSNVLEMYGLSTPKPEYQTHVEVAIGQDDNPYGVADNGGAAASALSTFANLVNVFDHHYQVGDFGRIESILGGDKKRKIDVQIKINMEI